MHHQPQSIFQTTLQLGAINFEYFHLASHVLQFVHIIYPLEIIHPYKRASRSLTTNRTHRHTIHARIKHFLKKLCKWKKKNQPSYNLTANLLMHCTTHTTMRRIDVGIILFFSLLYFSKGVFLLYFISLFTPKINTIMIYKLRKTSCLQ